MLVLADIDIAKRFVKSGVFGFFGLFLIAIIGWPILAFGKARYNDPSQSVPTQGGLPAAPQQYPSAGVTS
jgi:hypothetical protein